MTDQTIYCGDCGSERSNIYFAQVCCDSGAVKVNDNDDKTIKTYTKNESLDDIAVSVEAGKITFNDETMNESDTNKLGQEKWEEFVEEEVIEAEYHLERAIEACDDNGQRGALLGTYRDIVGFLFRHYDLQYEANNDE